MRPFFGGNMTFKEKILSHFNLSLDDYNIMTMPIDINSIESPNNFKNIDEVTSRINAAIKNDEKIMVYGDYDCDGICATSILVKTFKMLNKDIGFYIPSRYIDGYGITLDKAKLIVKKGYQLVITVDNGVSAHDALIYLKENNVDVIIVDHHEIINEIPPCFSIIHCDFKNNNQLKQCGGYLSFMLSIKLLNRINPYLLFLGCMATISDMMPLISYNRNIVKVGINLYNETNFKNIYALLGKNIIDEQDIGFDLCPKINAFGRIKEDTTVNSIVNFLTSDDIQIIKKLAKDVIDSNSYRKNILKNVLDEIDLSSLDKDKGVILYLPNISEGLIGLVAARIVNELNKPCIVFTDSTADGIIKGSARAISPCDLTVFFKKIENILEAYGGHQEAGGLSLKLENLDILKNQFNEYVKEMDFSFVKKEYIEIDSDDLTFDNYEFYRKLKPFGMNFEKPLFSLNIPLNNINILNNAHIKGKINDNCSFIGFNMSDKITSNGNYLGYLQDDNFKKGKNFVYNIVDIIY